MNTLTSYANKKAQQFLLAVLLTMFVSVFIPQYSYAQSYSGPLVITKGGTYKGNWESRNSEVPAIEVKTSEPVIITNSNIRGAGYLIKSWGHGANITVKHTNGYGLTPTPWSNYKKPRRFITADVFKNIVVENCYLENTAGVYLGVSYKGNNTSANTVKVRYNKVKNIDGRVYGGKDRVQFVQFNFKGAIKNAEVAWNQVINEPNNSAVEDNINVFNTQGTSDSPIRIHNNFIKGAYPVPANGTTYSGGGIITDTNADLATATKHVKAYENHLVNMGNYSMGIAGGNNIRYHNNRAVNSATFPDGSRFKMYTSGMWSNDYYKKGTTFSNSIDNNEIGITAWGYPNNRHDYKANKWASYVNNKNLPGPITLNTESDEYSRWKEKLSRNGIVLGPNGSGSSASSGSSTPVASSSTTTSTGKITREFWSKVYGTTLSAIPVTKAPSSKSELTSFEAPSGKGTNYGQRVRGYITAPVSGQYTFWIAADDMAALYLSTSEDPAKKVKIAAANKYTSPRQWTKSSTQQSAKITLQAGKRYYIEALHLQGAGGDNLAVGWQLPNGTMERPIAGKRLSPAKAGAAATESEETNDTQIKFTKATAYPSTFSDIVTLDLGKQNVKLTQVVITNVSGKTIHKVERIGLTNNKLDIHLGGIRMIPGLYYIKYTDSTGKNHSIKIFKG